MLRWRDIEVDSDRFGHLKAMRRANAIKGACEKQDSPEILLFPLLLPDIACFLSLNCAFIEGY